MWTLPGGRVPHALSAALRTAGRSIREAHPTRATSLPVLRCRDAARLSATGTNAARRHLRRCDVGGSVTGREGARRTVRARESAMLRILRVSSARVEGWVVGAGGLEVGERERRLSLDHRSGVRSSCDASAVNELTSPCALDRSRGLAPTTKAPANTKAEDRSNDCLGDQQCGERLRSLPRLRSDEPAARMLVPATRTSAPSRCISTGEVAVTALAWERRAPAVETSPAGRIGMPHQNGVIDIGFQEGRRAG